MFSPSSRYARLTDLTYRTSDGTEVVYRERRFLPDLESLSQVAYGEVRAGDRGRIDLLAARLLGDPLQFWRVCDGSATLDPAEVMADVAPGARIPVPLPTAVGK
jgi:hypothetical protein